MAKQLGPRCVTEWVAPALLALALAGCGAAGSGAAGTLAPEATATMSPAEHGQQLFRNKGCVTCHANDRVPGETGVFRIGPNLTHYRNDADFLRRWLANPKAVKPATQMPNLELTSAEIEALISFLNEPRG